LSATIATAALIAAPLRNCKHQRSGRARGQRQRGQRRKKAAVLRGRLPGPQPLIGRDGEEASVRARPPVAAPVAQRNGGARRAQHRAARCACGCARKGQLRVAAPARGLDARHVKNARKVNAVQHTDGGGRCRMSRGDALAGEGDAPGKAWRAERVAGWPVEER
jgi:hypothetical protein